MPTKTTTPKFHFAKVMLPHNYRVLCSAPDGSGLTEIGKVVKHRGGRWEAQYKVEGVDPDFDFKSRQAAAQALYNRYFWA
jgi:hypothetical protein